MALTPSQELKIIEMLMAYENGKRIDELPETDDFAGMHIEVTTEDGISKQVGLDSLLSSISIGKRVFESAVLGSKDLTRWLLAQATVLNSGTGYQVNDTVTFSFGGQTQTATVTDTEVGAVLQVDWGAVFDGTDLPLDLDVEVSGGTGIGMVVLCHAGRPTGEELILGLAGNVEAFDPMVKKSAVDYNLNHLATYIPVCSSEDDVAALESGAVYARNY